MESSFWEAGRTIGLFLTIAVLAERTAPTIAGLLHLLEGAVESVVRWSLRPKKGHLMPVGVTSLARSVVAGSRSLAHPGSFNATVRRAGEILAHRDAMLDTVAGNAGLMQVGTVCFAWAYAALVGFDLLAVLRGGTSGPSLVGYLLTAIVVSLPASLLRRVALNASFKRAIADPRADGAAQVSAELAGDIIHSALNQTHLADRLLPGMEGPPASAIHSEIAKGPLAELHGVKFTTSGRAEYLVSGLLSTCSHPKVRASAYAPSAPRRCVGVYATALDGSYSAERAEKDQRELERFVSRWIAERFRAPEHLEIPANRSLFGGSVPLAVTLGKMAMALAPGDGDGSDGEPPSDPSSVPILRPGTGLAFEPSPNRPICTLGAFALSSTPGEVFALTVLHALQVDGRTNSGESARDIAKLHDVKVFSGGRPIGTAWLGFWEPDADVLVVKLLPGVVIDSQPVMYPAIAITPYNSGLQPTGEETVNVTIREDRHTVSKGRLSAPHDPLTVGYTTWPARQMVDLLRSSNQVTEGDSGGLLFTDSGNPLGILVAEHPTGAAFMHLSNCVLSPLRELWCPSSPTQVA